MKKYFTAKFIVQGAIIAAMYAVLTIVFEPISYGVSQFRISEALVILPFFTPAAIPGLFVGCVIANLFGGFGILDVVIGSLATLIAAYATYKIKKPYLAPLPAVISNAILVALMLTLVNAVEGLTYWDYALGVGLGELVCAYALGLPLLYILKKYERKIFE